MTNFTIESISQLGGHRAMKYAVFANYQLQQQGWADPDWCSISWDDRAIIAVADDREILGIITWAKIDYRKEASIKLGYVGPQYRRAGVYRRLYQYLISEARGFGLQSIRSAVKVDNQDALAMVKSLGRELESYNTVHWL